MQHTTGVAILATHLAITDRRALSQAWYSALHVADHTAAARAPRSRADGGPLRAAAVRPAPIACGAQRGAGTPSTPNGHRPTAARGRGIPAFAPERRLPQTELAQRIERGLARRVRRGVPASFAVSVAGGRVRLLVRSDGTRTRVVAVCAPNVRERVDRALAHARFALAATGLRTEPA